MDVIYLRLRHKIQAKLNESIRLRDVAQIVASPHIKDELIHLNIHTTKPKDKSFVVIDAVHVIAAICEQYPGADVQMIGPAQTIIEIQYRKKNLAPVFFLGVWLLLFVGAALAIMNFHEDVSMQAVHQKIYKIITGDEKYKPLLLQIPYSLGLGIGMVLFFNHLFRKRFNEEPSPLEVEMFNYQQDLDRYITFYENRKGSSNYDDR